MRIEIISVSAVADGAEMVLRIRMSDEDGKHSSDKRLLIFTDKYLELGLRRGSVIDEATFDELERVSERCRAIKKGGDLLSYSSVSKAQLALKLRQRGFDAENAAEAAKYLETVSLIDEKSNVKSIVAGSMKKLWGRKRIYSELMKRGYDRSTVSEELGLIDVEEFIENCKRLILKKVRDIPSDPVERRKLVGFLARYGYSISEIKAAMERALR